MTRRLFFALLSLSPLVLASAGAPVLLTCSSPPVGGGGGSGAGAGGGSGGSGGLGDRYTRVVLDADSGGDRGFMAMAVDATQQRVGIAYLVGTGEVTDGGMTPDYHWKYVEWKNGVVSTPETIATVQRFVGVDIAFQANGEPAVAYLGGGSDMSNYWFQSDSVISRRTGGTWTEETVVSDGNMALCPLPNPVSNIVGILEGLWPALLIDGSTEWLWYRDGHNAQFPMQDWAGSDVELAKGNVGSWQHVCVNPGGNTKGAWGGHIRAAFDGDKAPGIIYDKMPGGANVVGNSVYFQHLNADGTWAGAGTVIDVANTQSGASLAWDSQKGFGVAVISKVDDTLYYTQSTNNGRIWDTADPVIGSGSGGWYPWLAFDPSTHEPAIAYYYCSSQAGSDEASCRPTEDELRITQRNDVSKRWNDEVVDAEGGSIPRLAFLPNGKRVVAYRARGTNVMKLAVEK